MWRKMFPDEDQLTDLIYEFYKNGGKKGEEPPEVLDALKTMKDYGRKYQLMMVESGGWM